MAALQVPSPSLTSTTSPRQQRLLAQQQATAAAAPTVINQLPDHLGRAVINNAILLIDKPPEWSAMDVVRAIRLAFKLKKVGHTGPLDNMATGLMIICLGECVSKHVLQRLGAPKHVLQSMFFKECA